MNTTKKSPQAELSCTGSFPEIVLSSTCFTERRLRHVCNHLKESPLRHLELSGNLEPLPETALRDLLSEFSSDIRFYVHNYFPAPKEPFVLNLGHPDTCARAIVHCQQAIDLCSSFGITQYSVHAGYAISPAPADLGHDQHHLVAIDFAESRALFIEAALEVADYAQMHGVEILFENNVVAPFNCPDGRNDRYHLSGPDDAEHLMILFEHPSVGMMLDVGHLKVSALTLGFNPRDFAERFGPHVRAVQISDNDGTADQNRPVKPDSWFWEHVPWDRAAYVSLEVSGQTIETLKAQIDLTRRKIAQVLHARS